jgi:hypothetical protein
MTQAAKNAAVPAPLPFPAPEPAPALHCEGSSHTIGRSQQYFEREQHAEGYWHRPLEANATMDAEYVFFMPVSIFSHGDQLGHACQPYTWETTASGGAETIVERSTWNVAGRVATTMTNRTIDARTLDIACAATTAAASRLRWSSAGRRVLRPVPVGWSSGDACRARPSAELVPDQHLRDVELGARNGGAARGADGEKPLVPIAAEQGVEALGEAAASRRLRLPT